MTGLVAASSNFENLKLTGNLDDSRLNRHATATANLRYPGYIGRINPSHGTQFVVFRQILA